MNIIEQLIAEDNLREALDKLSTYYPSSDTYKANTRISLLARLSAWERERDSDTKEPSYLNRRRNVIKEAVLSFAGDVAQEYTIPKAVEKPVKDKDQSNESKNKLGDKKIYFSYAWGDSNEQGESREKIVNELYDSLMEDGFRVIRDKMDLNYGGLISAFMEEIGEGDLIVVFVSRKYAKSPYCMFELYEIARNSSWDKQKFAQRILPVPVEFVDFGDPDVLDEHFDYWEKEEKKWASFIQKRIGQISEGQSTKYHNIKNIHQNFGNLSDWLVDINASTTKLLSQNDFAQIKQAIINRLGS